MIVIELDIISTSLQFSQVTMLYQHDTWGKFSYEKTGIVTNVRFLPKRLYMRNRDNTINKSKETVVEIDRAF